MYDLLLIGGEVLDSEAGIRGSFDIGITGSRIETIASKIASKEATRTIDIDGALVVPGLIDLHTHIYNGVTPLGIDPDIAGIYAGVCTVVDAGSGGSHTFHGLVKYIVPQAKTHIFAFVNIGRIGLSVQPEITKLEDIDLEGTIRVIEAYRPLTQGVKYRLFGPSLRDLGEKAICIAKQAAKETGTRLMVHIGDNYLSLTGEDTRQMLRHLEHGDILTHVFTGLPGNILDINGRVFPELYDAIERGVILDIAPGRTSFSFDAARKILDQGIKPHCISTDMSLTARHTTLGSITEVMSKFLVLGFSLDEVVRMATINPARALNMENDFGSLAVGREADITVLKLIDGKFNLWDPEGVNLSGDKAIIPILTIRGGHIMPLDWGPRPRGWLPETS